MPTEIEYPLWFRRAIAEYRNPKDIEAEAASQAAKRARECFRDLMHSDVASTKTAFARDLEITVTVKRRGIHADRD